MVLVCEGSNRMEASPSAATALESGPYMLLTALRAAQEIANRDDIVYQQQNEFKLTFLKLLNHTVDVTNLIQIRFFARSRSRIGWQAEIARG